jgi:uroporphyrinogen-III decarboxylase
MTNRDRFLSVLKGKMPNDRLPLFEYAIWWDLTIDRWWKEGLPTDLEWHEINTYFGLDSEREFWIRPQGEDCPLPKEMYGDIIKNDVDFERIKQFLYPADAVSKIKDTLISLKKAHEAGETMIWLNMNGFFWHPRELLGVENHLYAFYDEPELMHKINQYNCDFIIKVIKDFCCYIKPDYFSFAEDFSYNHGPMLSKELFEEFIKPYYQQVLKETNSRGITTIVDTDGFVEPMIDWLVDAGIQGIFPLERQSGVDVVRIKKNYPNFILIGGYDKMVMKHGEDAMRQEFERILPAMKAGGYIPGTDHQTPPDVSLDNYRIYLKLLKEYCTKAVK